MSVFARSKESSIRSKETLHTLYNNHIEPLRPALIALTETNFGRDEAEDFAQETLTRAYHHVWTYRGDWNPDSVRSWVITILYSVVSDHKRQAAVRNEAEYEDALTLDEPSPAQRSEWWDYCRRDVHRLLRLAVMPDLMKQAVLLRMQNLTQVTIGILLDLTQQEVSHLLGDGLRRLERAAALHSSLITLDSMTFRRMARHCRYQRPQKRGAFLTNQKLRRLR